MNTTSALCEIAAIKSIAHAETVRGQAFTEAERAAFKMGFFGGSVHGMEVAMETLKTKASAA